MQNELSHKILDAMRRAGLTQGELAKKLKVSQSTVSDWLKKGSRPNPKKLKLIQEMLGVDFFAEKPASENVSEKQIQDSKFEILHLKGIILQLESVLSEKQREIERQHELLRAFALGKVGPAGLTARTTRPGKTEGLRRAGVIS